MMLKPIREQSHQIRDSLHCFCAVCCTVSLDSSAVLDCRARLQVSGLPGGGLVSSFLMSCLAKKKDLPPLWKDKLCTSPPSPQWHSVLLPSVPPGGPVDSHAAEVTSLCGQTRGSVGAEEVDTKQLLVSKTQCLGGMLSLSFSLSAVGRRWEVLMVQEDRCSHQKDSQLSLHSLSPPLSLPLARCKSNT